MMFLRKRKREPLGLIFVLLLILFPYMVLLPAVTINAQAASSEILSSEMPPFASSNETQPENETTQFSSTIPQNNQNGQERTECTVEEYIYAVEEYVYADNSGDNIINFPDSADSTVFPMEEPNLHACIPFFEETFFNKSLQDNHIVDPQGDVVWDIKTAREEDSANADNMITPGGALLLSGTRYRQSAVLSENAWPNQQNYAMEFTINVQNNSNEGHNERPIATIIPRSKDTDLTEYYAVIYYLETKHLGAIVANLFQCKWAIVNTAAPTKMEPLVEGYFMMRENTDYTGRLIITNTPEENVNIKFFLDGPTNPLDEYTPLLEYTDSSPFKILTGATGPAYGTTGYADDSWGYSPAVQYDNIKLYEPEEFTALEGLLKENVQLRPQDIPEGEDYNKIKYLLNRGLVELYEDNTFRPDSHVSVGEFVYMLVALEDEKYPEEKSRGLQDYIYNLPVSKYQVAAMITDYMGDPVADPLYMPLIKDGIPPDFQNAVHYTFQEGFLRLDEDFQFNGDQLITRYEAVDILLRLLHEGFRKVNYALELPHILSSGAVLQRDKKIPIWGRGFTGETITVEFKNQVKTTVVRNGYWYLELDPEPSGSPYTLIVRNTVQQIILEDIHVGEVFIVGGQSNAEMFLRDTYGAEATKENLSGKSDLRFYTSEKLIAVTPNFTSKGQWYPAYNWMLDWSPAIGTYFVEKILELNDELANVPIGIIRLSYGGSTIELFMPRAITEEMDFVQKDDEPIMSGYWNGFMDAVAPYAVKGMIYYQGENSTQLGYDYELLLRDYLRGIRIEFQDPDLPIMLVQLAGYGENYYETDIDSWPVIREVQHRVANTTDNTGLVTAVDLSDPDPLEIHPREKKEIGCRLAYLAMDMIYEKDLKQRSPEMKHFLIKNNKVIIDFAYVYSRLFFKNDMAGGFEILDNEGRWHAAEAKINPDNTVEIRHEDIPEPQGARYAWHNYPDISLFQQPNLPVLPFNTTVTMEKKPLVGTGDRTITLFFHGLNDYDGIVNATRGNRFRMIERKDIYTIFHEFTIEGQTAGDTIYTFLRLLPNVTAQQGTTSTSLIIPDHGLSEGDWIRNNDRGWEPRRVNAVPDKNTIEIETIAGQSEGDEIERYLFKEKRTAQALRIQDECFIATAAFGSKMSPAVALLRQFRDDKLLTNRPGRTIVNFYYSVSPPIAEFIAGSYLLKAIMRVILLPVIVTAYLLLHPELLCLLIVPACLVLYRRRRNLI